ncbi:MAG: heme-binding domain-containing protein [Saprospiraceae bacterium]|nr:heme-binding domain-containing protein [Saprospiraceae bacterium]
MKKIILTVVILALIVIQFFGIDKTNPPVDPDQDFLTQSNGDAELLQLIETACYDCHSHTTEYPWYTSVAPFSWWINGHITEAREHLNFSEFGTYSQDDKEHLMKECVEVLREKEMPLLSYMIMHRDAWIDDEQRERMADFFESQASLY